MSLRVTRSQDIDLASLLSGVDTGEVVLPNFQRDFDWTDLDVRALLGTILNGWPIGSLLLIEGDRDRDFYDPRPIEGAPPIGEDFSFIILDGQQRLTALYQALYDRGTLVYALKLARDRSYEGVDALDDALVSLSRDHWERLGTPSAQWAAGYLPIYALRDAPTFFQWRDAAIAEDDIEAREWLTSTYRSYLSGIHNYRIPSVIIGAAIGPGAVARIFERVNRTGRKLGTFDLMVAKSFSEGFNLRSLWETARTEHEILARFLDDDGLPILSVIALRQRSDVRQSAVLELPGSAIRDGWHEAVGHFVSALEFASTRLGVVDPDWLPYKPLLTVLGATDYDKDVESQEGLLRRWYWATALGGRYDVGSNTTAVADFKKLTVGDDPITRVPVLVRENVIESTRGQRGAFHRAFLTAVASNVSAHEPGADLQRARAVSKYSRTDGRLSDPPLHLRTLGFYLELAQGDGGWNTPPHQFGDFDAQMDPQIALELRMNALVAFASAASGIEFRLLSSVEADEEDV